MENKQPSFRAVLIVIAFLCIFMIGFIVSQEYTIRTGQEVYLDTAPVDPRDPLRWDYVILRYDIERDSSIEEIIRKNDLKNGDTIYLILNLDDAWVGNVASVSMQPPSTWLFIKWEVGNWNSIDLWIWKYFVPEWTWRQIERVRGDMQVLTAIDKYGIAKIKDLYYRWEKVDPDTFVVP